MSKVEKLVPFVKNVIGKNMVKNPKTFKELETNTVSANLNLELLKIWDPSRDFVPFVQSKKRENTHGETSTCNFTKSNSLPWVFFTFFKFHEWYRIARSITSNQDRL